MNECKKCDGRGVVFVANGPDDYDKEPCDHVMSEAEFKRITVVPEPTAEEMAVKLQVREMKLY